MYVLVFPFALGGIAGPATQAILTREVGASEQGELQGTLGSLQSLTSIAGAAFFAAAMLNAIGFTFAWRLFSRLHRAQTTP